MFKSTIAAFAALLASAALAAVDVNTASLAELEAVKGIGPAKSTRIVDERGRSKFKDWEDLSARVKGVGGKNAEKYSAEGLRVNGVAYAGGPSKPAAGAARNPAGVAPAASGAKRK